MRVHFWLSVLFIARKTTGQTCSNGKAIPPGYTKSKGQYYKLHNDVIPYVDAMKKCSEEGAHLARFKTQVDFDDIVAKKGETGNEIWMDLFNIKLLHNDPVNGKLYWGDGDVFIEEPWMVGFDVNDPAVCMRMARLNGYTGDRSCTGSFQTLCQWDCEDPVFQLTACPGGEEKPSFYNYYGNLYKFISTPKTWKEQRAVCQADSGDLATFKTAKEYMAILQFQGTFFTSFFVGLQNLANEPCKTKDQCGHLTWVDGAPFESLDFLPEIIFPDGLTQVDVGVLSETSFKFGFNSKEKSFPALCQIQCPNKCLSLPPSPTSNMASNFQASTSSTKFGAQVMYVYCIPMEKRLQAWTK